MNSLSVLNLNLKSRYGLFRLARDPDATRYVFMIGDAQDTVAERLRVRRTHDIWHVSASSRRASSQNCCASP